eukprot:CAMPEP_0171323978 /NCGR_PEP_ID=MMETSP0816-20121228/115906_1 /TAXON_ID=420281 /ORGANISM="Proboscia inermis, Strain CCAP1064/1" /LENGTH=76 /DNA_ID=CAMNT_0011822807 /DNA_START=868 /DNA_END=1098 /DNA_ORIENTATION=+
MSFLQKMVTQHAGSKMAHSKKRLRFELPSHLLESRVPMEQSFRATVSVEACFELCRVEGHGTNIVRHLVPKVVSAT